MEKNKKKNYNRAKTAGTLIMTLIGIILPFWQSFLWPVTILTLWTAILLLISEFSKESIWKSFIIPAVITIFCGLSLFAYDFYTQKSKQITFATPEALISPLLQNMSIRISDLARDDIRIQNKSFENCRIYGPAVIGVEENIMAIHTTFQVSSFDANDGFIETTNKHALGVIILKNCIFRNCTLHDIVFIGNNETITKLKKDFNVIQ